MPEKINGINGIGPKAMENIEAAIEALTSVMPKDEEPAGDAEGDSEVEPDESVEAELAETPTEAEVSEAKIEAQDEESQIDESVEPEEPEEISEPVSQDLVEPESAVETAEEETPQSLEEIFDIQPEMLDVEIIEDDDEDIDPSGSATR